MNCPDESKDRRKARRVPCSFTFSIQRLSEKGGLASAIDVSTGGMRFQYVGKEISPAEKIIVQFTFQSSTYSFCGRPLRISVPEPFTQEVALLFEFVDLFLRSEMECGFPKFIFLLSAR